MKSDVRLSAADGRYVKTIEVEYQQTLPQVVVWEGRAFTRYQRDDYREATAYFVPDPTVAWPAEGSDE